MERSQKCRKNFKNDATILSSASTHIFYYAIFPFLVQSVMWCIFTNIFSIIEELGHTCKHHYSAQQDMLFMLTCHLLFGWSCPVLFPDKFWISCYFFEGKRNPFSLYFFCRFTTWLPFLIFTRKTANCFYNQKPFSCLLPLLFKSDALFLNFRET